MGTWEQDHPQTIIYYKDKNFVITNGGDLYWYYFDVESDEDLLYDEDIFLMELNLDWRNLEEDLEYIENIQVL